MSLSDVVRIVRRRAAIIGVVALAFTAAAVAFVQTATPIYEATSSVYFALPRATSGNDLSQGSNYTQAQMLSYADLADQPIVLEPVIRELGLPVTTDELAGQVTAQASSDTVVLALTAADPSAKRAAAIANNVAQQLIATTTSLSPRTDRGVPAIKGTVVAVATPPRYPSSPRKRRDVVAGLLAGLILGGLAALLRERTDTRLRTAEDIGTQTSIPVVGEVPVSTALQQRKTYLPAAGGEAEAFRRIRTNLEFLTHDQTRKSLVVTSSLAGEGKSTTCIRLGVALAEAGLRVLLVDADLRRPSIASYLGLEPSVGLSTVLVGRASLDDLVQPGGHPSLQVLCSGDIPPNPAELLGSASMRQLLDQMTDRYDVVLLDSPPLLAVTDAAVLSRTAASTVLVARCGHVRRKELREALAGLETIDARVIGVIANQVDDKKSGTYQPYSTPTRDEDGVRAPGPARHLLARRSG